MLNKPNEKRMKDILTLFEGAVSVYKDLGYSQHHATADERGVVCNLDSPRLKNVGLDGALMKAAVDSFPKQSPMERRRVIETATAWCENLCDATLSAYGRTSIASKEEAVAFFRKARESFSAELTKRENV